MNSDSLETEVKIRHEAKDNHRSIWRFRFSAALARPVENPFGSGAAWMAMELAPDRLAGIKGRVEYPPPFGELE